MKKYCCVGVGLVVNLNGNFEFFENLGFWVENLNMEMNEWFEDFRFFYYR